MIMKYILIIPFFFCIEVFGQHGYYATETTSKSGVTIIDGGEILNAQVCQVKSGDRVVRFSPNDISEYGFKDSRVYFSKEIRISDSLKRVFLERLVKGKSSLYYFRGRNYKTFYLERNDSLVELRRYDKNLKSSFRENLEARMADLPGLSDAARIVAYRKNTLQKLIKWYNDGFVRPFPHFRFGIMAGGESTVANYIYKTEAVDVKILPFVNFKSDMGIVSGIFIDNPVALSNISYHSELYFSMHRYAYQTHMESVDGGASEVRDISFNSDISTLKLPMLLRYTYPSMKIRPFVNIGGIVAYNIKNKSSVYESGSVTGHPYVINLKEADLIPKFPAGFALGAGMEYKLTYRSSVFLEIRYDRLYGLSPNNTLNNSEFSIITSYNF